MSGHRIDKRAIYALMDHRLSEKKAQRLRDHLAQCPVCQAFSSRIAQLKRAAGEAVEEPLPDWTRLDHRMTRIIAELNQPRPTLFLVRKASTAAAVFLVFAATGALALTLLLDYLGTPSAETGNESSRTVDVNPSRPSASADSPPVDTTDEIADDAGGPLTTATISAYDTAAPASSVENAPLDIEEMTATPDSSLSSREQKERRVRRWPGHLPMDAIRRTLNETNTGIRKCYERALKRDPRLTLTFDVVLSVGKDGAISSVEIKNGTPDAELTACIEQQFGAVSFPPPKGGAMRLVMPMRLYPSS